MSDPLTVNRYKISQTLLMRRKGDPQPCLYLKPVDSMWNHTNTHAVLKCSSSVRDELKQKWQCELTWWRGRAKQTEGRRDRGEKEGTNSCEGQIVASRTVFNASITIKPKKNHTHLHTNTHTRTHTHTYMHTAQAIIVPCGDFGLSLLVSHCCWPTLLYL